MHIISLLTLLDGKQSRKHGEIPLRQGKVARAAWSGLDDSYALNEIGIHPHTWTSLSYIFKS